MRDVNKLIGFIVILSSIPTVAAMTLTILFLPSNLWIIIWPIALFFPFLFWLKFFDRYKPNVYIISQDELEISVLGIFKMRKEITETKNWTGDMSLSVNKKVQEEGMRYWRRLWRKFRKGY